MNEGPILSISFLVLGAPSLMSITGYLPKAVSLLLEHI